MSPEVVRTIETALVACVLLIQLVVFIRTWYRISAFRRMIPDIDRLQIARIPVSADDLQHLSPQEIIAKYATSNKTDHTGKGFKRTADSAVVVDGLYHPLPQEVAGNDFMADEDEDGAEVLNVEQSATEEVSLLLVKDKPGSHFEKIRRSINNYLIRNRGAASDFDLIKDVVERNANAIEEDINLSVAVPLYLGLMGTMLGIVIGLFNMPDLGTVLVSGSDAHMDEGINMLIGGVRIAMIASFAGLFFTVVNSGWLFRSARRQVEARKNELYTLVQIELLPIINQGMAATLSSLQRNLLAFNNEFKGNLEGLKDIFISNKEAVRAQKELLDTIAEAKISEMAKYNVKVLNKLEGSVVQLERFQEYLVQVNLLVGGTQQIVTGVNGFLARTEEVKRVADTIDQRLHESGRLMEFLSDHFSKLEDHKAFTAEAVADVGHAISGTFHELKDHIGKSTDAVKQFTVDELDALRTALSESRTNLSNLGHLEALAKDVAQMKASTASQMERLKEELGQTLRALGEMNASLRAVDGHLAKRGLVASVKHSWRKLWGKGRNGSGLN